MRRRYGSSARRPVGRQRFGKPCWMRLRLSVRPARSKLSPARLQIHASLTQRFAKLHVAAHSEVVE